MNHRLRLHCWLTATLLLASLANATPGLTPAGYSYPFDNLQTEQDLSARLMSGGCWLAGLPGYPSYNGRNVHAGVDLRATLGEVIYAVAAGTVESASDTIHSGYGPGWTPGYAVLVRSVLADGTSLIIIYGHTQNHRVKGGDIVVPGQALAEVGPWLAEEGGPHLHLTVRLGELPRWGWGTPTRLGQSAREGTEMVTCGADVEAVGYRNPLEFLKGNLRPCVVAPPPPSEPTGPFGAASASHWRQRKLPETPTPAADPFSRNAQPVRCGQGWLQTFALQGKPAGALLQRTEEAPLHWVPEPLWTVYNLQGGAAQLGFPVAEAYDWPDAKAQGFEKALLVLEKGTDRVRVIWRER